MPLNSKDNEKVLSQNSQQNLKGAQNGENEKIVSQQSHHSISGKEKADANNNAD
jgi:hypothetical protein